MPHKNDKNKTIADLIETRQTYRCPECFYTAEGPPPDRCPFCRTRLNGGS